MKKIFVLTALCLMAFIGTANNYRGDDHQYRVEAKGIVEKTFDVSANPTLEMEGKYSDFIITTWDNPQIDFLVKITVKGNDGKKVEARFNTIDIDLEQVGNRVMAKTVFGDYNYKTFDGSISIKYYVKVPNDVSFDLDTKYGDITLDEANKKLNVDIKYGDFKADNINIDSTQHNQISIKYGNANIDVIKRCNMDLVYGEAKIYKCDYIDGTLKYSKIFITELNEGMLENKYSTARIEKAYKIVFVNNAYSDLKVSEITHMLSANIKYTNMKATVISERPLIDIEGMYSDVVLYIDERASFNYVLNSSYSDITFRGFFDTKTIGKEGKYGDGEPGLLSISTRYGDVDIYKRK